jgi:ankyrin repeat protein
MKISKHDLCSSCRKIRTVMGDGKPFKYLIEEILDGKRYNDSTAWYVIGHYMILTHLEQNGGCPSCINLLKSAIQSSESLEELAAKGKKLREIEESWETYKDFFRDVRKLSITDIRHFIKENAPDINMKNSLGLTLLHLAALHAENAEVAEILISMGADVNIKSDNKDSFTPLHFTATCGNINVANVLISHSANVNAKGNADVIPLHVAVFTEKNVEFIKFLVSHGANVNAKAFDGYTPLHYAVNFKDIDVAKVLVSNGAYINSKTNTGGSPLDLARIRGDAAMVQSLSSIIVEKEKIKIDQILADYADALRNNPNDADIYKKRGLEFLNKGFFDQAIADYTQFIQLKPDDVEAYKYRGMAYSQKTECLQSRGINYSQIEEYDQAAIDDFNQVLKLTPDDAVIYGLRGETYLEKTEYDKAIADFNEAIRLKPNEYLDYFSRGMAYWKLRQNDQAKRDLEKVLDLNPDNTTLYKAKNVLKELYKEEQKDR